MTITVEELRRKYPEPKRFSKDWGPDDYCVGTALCRELKERGYKPSFIPDAMRRVNPRLEVGPSLDIAVHITKENDAGNFEDAWAWLDKGLSA